MDLVIWNGTENWMARKAFVRWDMEVDHDADRRYLQVYDMGRGGFHYRTARLAEIQMVSFNGYLRLGNEETVTILENRKNTKPVFE
jgi:hypothetical protein